MLKERSTYEIMRPMKMSAWPKPIWSWASIAVAQRWPTALERWAFFDSAEQLQIVFERFKNWLTRESCLRRDDIVALIQNVISGEVEQSWTLVRFEVSSGTGRSPRVTLTWHMMAREYTQTVEWRATARSTPRFGAVVETHHGLKVVC